MPATDGQSLQTVATTRRQRGEAAGVEAEPHDSAGYGALFDRGPEFGTLLADHHLPRQVVKTLQRVMKQAQGAWTLTSWWRSTSSGERAQTVALRSPRPRHWATAPDEPHSAARAVRRRWRSTVVWATRRRPWVDRLASAWLIRRFIDAQARFLWLKSPADCPKRAIGFDFDGATFTHAGAMVTFETLLATFDLQTPALLRLGVLVHSLDAGGVIPPEAAGVERVLAGMRDAITDDDQLVLTAAGVFEGLLVAFEKEVSA
jgi:hypothetical protein